MDGLRVYSAVGPIKVTAIADSHVTSLRLSSTGRREVTSAFCAADRDPEKHRFATIRTFACLSGERDRGRGDSAITARMGRQRLYTTTLLLSPFVWLINMWPSLPILRGLLQARARPVVCGRAVSADQCAGCEDRKNGTALRCKVTGAQMEM